jgi:hypothetical protein
MDETAGELLSVHQGRRARDMFGQGQGIFWLQNNRFYRRRPDQEEGWRHCAPTQGGRVYWSDGCRKLQVQAIERIEFEKVFRTFLFTNQVASLVHSMPFRVMIAMNPAGAAVAHASSAADHTSSTLLTGLHRCTGKMVGAVLWRCLTSLTSTAGGFGAQSLPGTGVTGHTVLCEAHLGYEALTSAKSSAPMVRLSEWVDVQGSSLEARACSSTVSIGLCAATAHRVQGWR